MAHAIILNKIPRTACVVEAGALGGQARWHTQSSATRFLEQLALLKLGLWEANRIGTRLKNTHLQQVLVIRIRLRPTVCLTQQLVSTACFSG